MEARKIGKITVNDGNGLFDSLGLIDSLISDCNRAVQQCVCGQYVGFCCTIVQMVQKLGRLKNGIQDDLEYKNKTIAELKKASAEEGKMISSLLTERAKEGGEHHGKPADL